MFPTLLAIIEDLEEPIKEELTKEVQKEELTKDVELTKEGVKLYILFGSHLYKRSGKGGKN